MTKILDHPGIAPTTSMHLAYGSPFSGRAASNNGPTTKQGARLAGGNDYIVCMLGLCQEPASSRDSNGEVAGVTAQGSMDKCQNAALHSRKGISRDS